MGQIVKAVDFYIQTCIYRGYGIHFGVPIDWDDRRKKDHAAMYCPNGHVQFYMEETKEEKLRDQLKVSCKEHNQCVVRLTEEVGIRDKEITHLNRSRANYKGRLGKLKSETEESPADKAIRELGYSPADPKEKHDQGRH